MKELIINQRNSIKLRGKILFHALHNVLCCLGKEKIKYAVIKGEVSSLYIYNKLGMRKYNDIDILINKKDIDKVDRILKSDGFLQYTSDNKLASRLETISSIVNAHQTISYKKWIHPYNICLEIDINFSIMWGEYTGKQIDVDKILDNVNFFQIYEEDVRVLSIPYAFIQTLLHNYKDCNSIYILANRNSINSFMFKEVYLFWKNCKTEVSIEWIVTFAKRNKIRQYLFYILYYTNRIYSDRELGKYVDALRDEEGIRLLNMYGLTQKESRRWTVSFEERLMESNQFELLKDELGEEDMDKILYNSQMF